MVSYLDRVFLLRSNQRIVRRVHSANSEPVLSDILARRLAIKSDRDVQDEKVGFVLAESGGREYCCTEGDFSYFYRNYICTIHYITVFAGY